MSRWDLLTIVALLLISFVLIININKMLEMPKDLYCSSELRYFERSEARFEAARKERQASLDWQDEINEMIIIEVLRALKETEITESNDYRSGQSIDQELVTPKIEDFLPNETEGFTPYEPISMPKSGINPLSSTGTERLDRAIKRSMALAEDRSFAYNFSCGYEIDGILIHEGVPRYGQEWWGFATKDKIVIKHGLRPDDKMMVFAHELKHILRMINGSFDSKNLEEEERIAYLYGWNESNWDIRILQHRCVE